jgi:hypothetical protein
MKGVRERDRETERQREREIAIQTSNPAKGKISIKPGVCEHRAKDMEEGSRVNPRYYEPILFYLRHLSGPAVITQYEKLA